jgi:ATP-binding cassette, subfamily C, bacterial
MQPQRQNLPETSPLREAVARCRAGFIAVGLLTAVVNVLMLTGSVYMLQVYDRVLPSRSIPTLVALSIAVLIVYVFLGVFDWARQRILSRIGAALDESLSGPVVASILRITPKSKSAGSQPARDLDTVRGFLSSMGPTALFDLPWIPLYAGLCFLLHPLLGWTLVAGAVLLVLLTLWSEFAGRAPAKDAATAGAQKSFALEAARRNAELVAALGMEQRVVDRIKQHNARHGLAQQRASDVSLSIGSISKTLRFVLQSTNLGLGAWLVVQGEASGGVMIASSILTSRALAPVELAIGQWKPFLSARGSWTRLNEALKATAKKEPEVAPKPASQKLTVEDIYVAAPGSAAPILKGINLSLEAGQALGVIGPSASGKSTLARALVGVWQANRGEIRLDGATLDQWPAEVRGGMIGYLPQDIELFDGTIADNICRFDPKATSADIQAAAEAAGANEMILRLANGYETQIGEAGSTLSGGQRQRIALARALYKDPFLVVLDEPNSNLDSEGELALEKAVETIRLRGGIAVVIAHRRSALAKADLALALNAGQQVAFGPKDEVLKKVLAPAAVVPQEAPALKAVAAQGARS